MKSRFGSFVVLWVALLWLSALLVGCRPISPEGVQGGGLSGDGAGRAPTLSATVVEDVSTTTPGENAPDEQATDEHATDDGAIDGGAIEESPEVQDAPDRDSAERAGNPVATGMDDSDLVAMGQAVYQANYCGVCHALADIGATGAFGPTHDAMGRIAEARLAAADYEGLATTPSEYIYESIVDPYIYLVASYEITAHRMPPYAHLEPDALNALVAFLLAQQ